MPRTGRPRAFDRDAAVERALRLFWARGYDATSLAQLKTAMGGLSTASFYAAFGSKDALFREVLARYLDTYGQATAPLRDPRLPPRDAVEAALRRSARMQTAPDHPGGCLMALSATTCASEDRHTRALLAAERELNRTALEECVQRAVADGALPPGTDVPGFAALFGTVLAGLPLQARDGVPFPVLDAAISQAMAAWDGPAVAVAQPD